MNDIRKVPVVKTTKVVTTTTTLELTPEEVEAALLYHYGMNGGEVQLDVSSGGYFRGAVLVKKEVESD